MRVSGALTIALTLLSGTDKVVEPGTRIAWAATGGCVRQHADQDPRPCACDEPSEKGGVLASIL